MPCDSAGTFDPKVLSKRQKNLPGDIERQIFALYARGNSFGDIRDFGRWWNIISLEGLYMHRLPKT